MINNFAATKSTKLFRFNSSELGVEMYNTLFVYFPSVSMFLICPCSTDSAGIANQYAKLFHCSLFLEVQEFNLLTSNGCVSIAIAKDIFAELDEKTDRSKDRNVCSDIETERVLLN